jgi:predicted dehydrogenase
MNNPTLKFALVGAGGIAQTHLQAFPRVSHADLVAVVDVRRDAAEGVAAANHCHAFTSIPSMLKDVSIDAAIVCTPPNTHPSLCRELAGAGVHILCEKPIALDFRSAQEMIQYANQQSVVLTMASKFRYVNDMIVAKQLVTSGILGDILLFENTFAGHIDMTKRWNSNPAISGGGVLIDNGTHSIDIVRYLLGPLESIQVIEGKRSQAIAVEDTVRIHAKTVKGTLAAIDLSWSINKQTPWYVSIYGTQGTVLIGWKESKYKRSTDQEWTVFGAGYDKSQAFASQLSNFCKAIDGQESLLITSDDAIASAYTMDRAYESLRKDDWIAVSMRETSVDRIAS